MSIRTKALSIIASWIGLSDPRLYQHLSGGSSNSGETVTIGTALQLDVVWACVRLISQTIATLPLFLYQRDSQGRGVIDDRHPLYRILHDSPNAEMTATEFWGAMVASLLLWGNAFGAIEWSGTGSSRRVIAITPLMPDRVLVKRQSDGSLKFSYSFQGKVTEFDESEIIHIKGFCLDGVMGISPVTQGRHTLGLAIAAEKAAGSLFRNGMRPSAVMTVPTYLTPAQRPDAQAFIDRFTGAVNAGRVILMEGGWKIETLSIPPEDAELLATRQFSVEQLCRWFDVPPIMIGHMDKSTAWGTGMEQMMLWFLTFSLRQHLKRIEQAIWKSLLTPAEQVSRYAEFNVEGLLRADSKARAELYGVLIDKGLRTPNELRSLDNEPPLPGGDSLVMNSTMLPIQLLGQFAKLPRDQVVDPAFSAITQKPGDPTGSQSGTGATAT